MEVRCARERTGLARRPCAGRVPAPAGPASSGDAGEGERLSPSPRAACRAAPPPPRSSPVGEGSQRRPGRRGTRRGGGEDAEGEAARFLSSSPSPGQGAWEASSSNLTRPTDSCRNSGNLHSTAEVKRSNCFLPAPAFVPIATRSRRRQPPEPPGTRATSPTAARGLNSSRQVEPRPALPSTPDWPAPRPCTF